MSIIRNKRVKSHKEIQMLNDNSTDIFHPSLIDTYYPSRPKKLELLRKRRVILLLA